MKFSLLFAFHVHLRILKRSLPHADTYHDNILMTKDDDDTSSDRYLMYLRQWNGNHILSWAI